MNIKTILAVLFSLFFAVVFSGMAYLRFFFPKYRAASDVKIEASPERVARGKYLVENVLYCYGCHSDRDYGFYAGPIKEETKGQGAACFDEKVGFPGVVCAQNITSAPETGIGAWTDGEVLRALREGVSRDGRALFPMMPYKILRGLSDDDANAVVAFIRTTPAIEKQTPEGYAKFPVSLFIRREPQPLDGPVPSIDPSDTVAYGEYLAKIAGCIDCHTPIDPQMTQMQDRLASGGRIFVGDWGTVVSPNLTAHQTGIGGQSKREFVSLFQSFNNPENQKVAVPKGGRNTIMPWFSFSQMKEEDLGAIYDYLLTLPKIENQVSKWPVSNSSGQ